VTGQTATTGVELTGVSQVMLRKQQKYMSERICGTKRGVLVVNGDSYIMRSMTVFVLHIHSSANIDKY
jgi:hypothetical protein